MSGAHAVSIGSHAATYTATGIPNGKLGMWVFLASEVMFFTGLIGTYIVLRMSNPHWPGHEGHLSVPIGTMNTLFLIGSSVTIVLSLAASNRGAMGPARGWLFATILLGALFLVVKGFEYHAKFSHEIFPKTNIFWSCYFTLTGFHALHVLGGIIYNLIVLSWTASERLWADRRHRLELAGLYWHFVDIVWVFLFPLLYLI